MKNNTYYRTLLGVFLLSANLSLSGQFSSITYLEQGKTNISEGPFIKGSIGLSAKKEILRLDLSFRFGLLNSNGNIPEAFKVLAGAFVQAGEHALRPSLIVMNNYYNTTVNVRDLAILTDYEKTHFSYTLGLDFKTYSYNNKALVEYNIEAENRKLSENWNLIWAIQYFLKPLGNKWNISLAITNIDDYLINQETNPFFKLSGYYDVNEKISLFGMFVYKNSGSFNLSSNHFGYQIKCGLRWKIL